jgi:hypothetical protein
MEPSRLEYQALRFELKIRNVKYNEEKWQANCRMLRDLIREEKANPEKCPKPLLVASKELPEITFCWDGMVEKTSLSWFKKRDKEYEDVYSMLCHVEARLSYLSWDEGMSEVEHEEYGILIAKVDEFREQHYATRKRDVVLKLPEQKNIVESVGFSEEKERELEELERKLEELKGQKARTTQPNSTYEISYAWELEDEDEDEEAEKGEIKQTERDEVTSEQQQQTRDDIDAQADGKFSVKMEEPGGNERQNSSVRKKIGSESGEKLRRMGKAKGLFETFRSNKLTMPRWKVRFKLNTQAISTMIPLQEIDNRSKWDPNAGYRSETGKVQGWKPGIHKRISIGDG